MTSLVALVCRAADAEAAIAGGVDRIVVRTSPLPELSAIQAAVSGRCPVSLWWHSDPASRDPAAAASACGADEIWGQAGNELPSGSAWATLAPGSQDDMADIAGRKRQGIVIDGGRERRLLEVASVAVLEEQCRRARKHGLTVGIAGAMEAPDMPRLLALAPDRLVVDDVIREGGASPNPVDPEQLRLVRDLMAAMRSSDGPRQSSIEAAAPDRIFVRDWTVPLHLGAYAHEREAQQVRFTVEAEIAPLGGRAADMRDVVTYDLITDAIARATVTHVALVETIAEDVAAMVLAHPRVEAVDITVEKLDLGPGSLGCRIRRRRA